MNVKCWASPESCIVMDGIPYCRVNRGGDDKTSFRQVGFITQPGQDPKPLFGKRKDRWSGEWRYYASDNERNVQYPIIQKNKNCMTHTRACQELENGDQVNVLGYSDASFNVSI